MEITRFELTAADMTAVDLRDSNYINNKGANLYKSENYASAVEYYRLAAAMGNLWMCQFTTTWRMSPIIFMVLIGQPSCGKTPPLRLAVKPFHLFDTELYNFYRKEKERYDMAMEQPKEEREANGFDKSPIKPVCRSVVTTNTTIEGLYANLDKNRRGILMHVDELDSFLGNMSRYSRGNDEAYWLQLFNGDEIKCDRKSSDDTIPSSIPTCRSSAARNRESSPSYSGASA